MISGLNRRHGAITGTDAAEGYVTIYAEVLKRFHFILDTCCQLKANQLNTRPRSDVEHAQMYRLWPRSISSANFKIPISNEQPLLSKICGKKKFETATQFGKSITRDVAITKRI